MKLINDVLVSCSHLTPLPSNTVPVMKDQSLQI